MKTFRLLGLLCVSTIILLLGSCGGGNDVSNTPAQTVFGVSAAGGPLVGTVYLKDSSNSPQELFTPVASDGSFSFKVNGLTAPFLLKAIGTVGGNNYTLYSFAAGTGVANVNPLSNLAVIEANGGDLTSLYATPDPTKMHAIKNALASNIAQIQTALQPTLSNFGATTANFISDPYVANHQGLDLLMDLISISVSNGTVTIVDKTANNTITSSLSNFVTDTINIIAPSNNSVCILPSASSVSNNRTVNFTAIIVGTVNQQVSWSVVETNGGTITSTGVYTAPTNAGTYHVMATSMADTTKNSKATVTVSSSLLSQNNWHALDSSSSAAQLYGVAYGNNIFVAVGVGYNYILTSIDGISWTVKTDSYTLGSLKDIAYGSNKFVAVGATNGLYNGTILVSSDNFASWQGGNSLGLVDDLQSITFGNGTFVASGTSNLGDTGVILTSTDGVNWSSKFSESLTWIDKIIYGNGTFVAIGTNESGGVIFTSNDNGATWVLSATGLENSFSDVAFGNNTFVAVGGGGAILTSSDSGKTWVNRISGTTYYITGIAFGNGVFVAVTNNSPYKDQVLISNNDGQSWSQIAFTTNYLLNKICYGNNKFVVVGDYGSYYSDTF